jgi:hypothetical protein
LAVEVVLGQDAGGVARLENLDLPLLAGQADLCVLGRPSLPAPAWLQAAEA